VPRDAPSGVNEQVLALVNEQRVAHGLQPLAYNEALGNAAQMYADTLASANHWSHTEPDGSTFEQRAASAGYTRWLFLAENLAAGYQEPREIVDGWMRSPGHRANILSAEATEAGVGHAYRGGTRFGHYWTLEFGAS